MIALAGAFVFAELSTVVPRVGGQYAFFRDAFHPLVAFLQGWTLLLLVESGAVAAISIEHGLRRLRVADVGLQRDGLYCRIVTAMAASA